MHRVHHPSARMVKSVDTWIDAKGYLVVAQSSNVVDAVIAAGFSLGNGFNSDGAGLRIIMVL